MNTIADPGTFWIIIAVALFAIAVVWAIPANCNDVPGPVLFASKLVRRLTGWLLMTLLYALVVVTAAGCIAAIAFVALCLAPIAILIWLFGVK